MSGAVLHPVLARTLCAQARFLVSNAKDLRGGAELSAA
jgi:hypothetical protein